MRRYKIESTGNGAFYTVTRIADGKQLFLQGDDALLFGDELSLTHERWADDDVCDEYFADDTSALWP